MSPSALVLGKRVSDAATAVLVQAVTVGITTCRRHRPIWITRGMFAPTGMLVSVKLPSAPVVVLTSGEPDAMRQLSHETPAVKAATGALGT